MNFMGESKDADERVSTPEDAGHQHCRPQHFRLGMNRPLLWGGRWGSLQTIEATQANTQWAPK